MGTNNLIARELPQWTKSQRRHAHFAKSLETEELADAELDIQLEIINAVSNKPASGPLDILLKLKLWQSSVFPNGDDSDGNSETQLILSAIKDLESFLASDGASMADYGQGDLAQTG